MTPAEIDAFKARVPTMSFFQAVSLLERAGFKIGRPGEPAEGMRLRFRALPSLGFPAGDIARLDWKSRDANGTSQVDMIVTFLGLFGPASPMPTHYSERAIASSNDNTALRDFLDLFNHCLIALLYEGWSKYRYYALYDRGARDAFSWRILSLAGLTTLAEGDNPALDRGRILPLATLLAFGGRSAGALERVLSSYFDGLPVAVEEFVPRWARITEDQQSRLGRSATVLGEDIVLGTAIEDVAGKFRIKFGPLSADRFARFLPLRDFATVVRLVRHVLRDQLAFDIVLDLLPGEAPSWQLGASSDFRLGWATWLAPRPDEETEVTLPGTLADGGGPWMEGAPMASLVTPTEARQ